MVDMYLRRVRINSRSSFTGILSSHRERGNNGVYVVEFQVEGNTKIPKSYLKTLREIYIMYVDRRKLKRPCCSLWDDRIHLEVDIKGLEELYEKVKKILSQ